MNGIGQNIRKIREKVGMTQDELAKKMGYTSRSAIAKIEASDRDFPTGKIREFAAALGVSVAELTTDCSEEMAIIARHLEKVPDADKERVIKALTNTIDLFIGDNKGE